MGTNPRPVLAAVCLCLAGVAPAHGALLGRRKDAPVPLAPQKPLGGGGDLPFHARDAADAVASLGTSLETGLDAAAVAARQAEHGPNKLVESKGTPLWKMLVDQFDDSLVKVLLATAAISGALAVMEREDHGWVEPAVILSILVLNAVVGVWQQQSAQGAVEALKRLTPVCARCLRNGEWVDDLPASELVPGDVIECRTGDKVPADCRIVELRTTTMRVDEASLTGESVTVDKTTDPSADASAPPAGQPGMLFASTMVSSGAAVAVVLKTGMRTEIGRIQQGVQDAAAEQQDTPLARKLERFGQQLTRLIGAICVCVWLLSIPRFGDAVYGSPARGALHHFKRSVALGVAAIPEGLPAVITLCLSLGTRRMAQRNAIVRKLPSVETLGCTTVICSDKTGTLTTNQMTVVEVVRPSQTRDGAPLQHHEVSGLSYATDDGELQGLSARDCASPGFQELLAAAALSNDATLSDVAAEPGRRGQPATQASVQASGEPTEAALLTLVGKAGRLLVSGGGPAPKGAEALPGDALAQATGSAVPYDPRDRLDKVATLEFTRARKSKSALVREAGSGRRGGTRLLAKGAPDSILKRCTDVMLPDGTVTRLDSRMRRAIEESYTAMGKNALRCIAFASRSPRSLGGSLASYDGSKPAAKVVGDPSRFADIESRMTFLGLVGIRDPPRPAVRPAIAACRQAGIRVIMITGDSKETAQAVAKDVGIFQPGDPLEAWTFVGKAFFALPPAQQESLLKSGNLVFCRAEPTDKQRLIRLLSNLGEVTAMTGDGVNDAPALRQAAIGIAMGITGTEVAKEASDMILADDNFASIVSAVEEGRSIYANMKSFIHYLITCNIGEVCAILLATAMGLPEVLSPLHLLWVNLVTDGPPATALGFNPPEKGLMSQKPRGYDDPLITPITMARFAATGTYIGVVCVAAFIHTYWRELGIPALQVLGWSNCHTWEAAKLPGGAGGKACDLFGPSSPVRVKANTMALSVLVVVECLRAFAAISETQSMFSIPPWVNPYLGLGMVTQVGLHALILYWKPLSEMFKVAALTKADWRVVLALSAPVLVLEEMLKMFNRAALRRRR